MQLGKSNTNSEYKYDDGSCKVFLEGNDRCHDKFGTQATSGLGSNLFIRARWMTLLCYLKALSFHPSGESQVWIDGSASLSAHFLRNFLVIFFSLSEGILYKEKTFVFERALSFFFLPIFMYRCRMEPKRQKKSYEFMIKQARPMNHNRYEVWRIWDENQWIWGCNVDVIFTFIEFELLELLLDVKFLSFLRSILIKCVVI